MSISTQKHAWFTIGKAEGRTVYGHLTEDVYDSWFHAMNQKAEVLDAMGALWRRRPPNTVGLHTSHGAAYFKTQKGWWFGGTGFVAAPQSEQAISEALSDKHPNVDFCIQ